MPVFEALVALNGGGVLSKYLYEVRIVRGRSHSEHPIFQGNVSAMNGKSGDFGGINAVCVISHHLDADTVHMLCTDGMQEIEDVAVEEITKESLNDPNSTHSLFTSLVENYFLPHGKYPNIE